MIKLNEEYKYCDCSENAVCDWAANRAIHTRLVQDPMSIPADRDYQAWILKLFHYHIITFTHMCSYFHNNTIYRVDIICTSLLYLCGRTDQVNRKPVPLTLMNRY